MPASQPTRRRPRSSVVGVPADEAHVFRTQLGWMALVVRDARVVRLTFGHDSPSAALAAVGATRAAAMQATAAVAALIRRLERFADGEEDDFRDVDVDFEGLTDFQRRVFARCRRIGRGKTLSYAELAEAIGAPGAARAVGNCMARNRAPIVVPCHRVVGAGGGLGGYSAAAGLTTKARLLALEGAVLAAR